MYIFLKYHKRFDHVFACKRATDCILCDSESSTIRNWKGSE